MTTLQVEAAVAGRKRAGAPDHPLVVALSAGPTSLRDLIEAVVRAEVQAFVARVGDQRLVRVLTEEQLVEGLGEGSVRSGGREVAAEVDPDSAVRTAVEAQQDGLFQTIVDDAPVDDLDEVIEIRDGTRVMFLRLVPLAGG
ncbi:MAG: hypothetical protein GY925_21865 [Actinomycetia bacterium]|nr:hypothetical protein [Actinomycetes bacterium]